MSTNTINNTDSGRARCEGCAELQRLVAELRHDNDRLRAQVADLTAERDDLIDAALLWSREP